MPSDPAIAALDDAWDAFFTAVRRARGRVQRDPEALGELTLPQYQLLVGLRGGVRQPVGEVALAGGVRGPTATRALDALEARGLVAREPSPDDRRVVTVGLTPAGEDAVTRTRAWLQAKRAEVFSELAPEEAEEAARLLRRLAEVIAAW